ncbi:hypothetical protein NP233_g11755 [Leucocoprinus birnbaumii]|uniref:Uncharacterized protein n=1 Tax=Leucocoprinus birnbaumii TaxID=56174 RepID=A0AAD5YNN3_9AGAR|nr:hypothetical protein NP233_g11755 [Leucocoprinus birnbaumii]
MAYEILIALSSMPKSLQCTVCGNSFPDWKKLNAHLRNKKCKKKLTEGVALALLNRWNSLKGEGVESSADPDDSEITDQQMADLEVAEQEITDEILQASKEFQGSPLDTRPSRLPTRTRRRPSRYAEYTDELPPSPPPIIPDDAMATESQTETGSGHSTPLFNQYQTPCNEFGVYHIYNYGPPSYSPDHHHSLDNVSDSPNFLTTNSNSNNWWSCFGSSIPDTMSPGAWFAPFLSASAFRLMKWFYGASNFKSLIELDRLVQDVLHAPDFDIGDLKTFRGERENRRLDDFQGRIDNSDNPLENADGWLHTSVDIPVPAEGFKYRKEADIPHYSVPGLFLRDPVAVIKGVLSEPGAHDFHLKPHQTFWRPSEDAAPERVYSEVYSANAMITEEAKLHSKPSARPELETVILSLMFWSDSTHLTSFGDASVWPIYMAFGNQSKYLRAKPSTFSMHHLAYIPKLGGAFHDWYHKTFGSAISGPALTNCRRSLVHAVWLLLLNQKFIACYRDGLDHEFFDGITRRIFFRIVLYGMDYPEKVIMALIRYFGNFPCPWCLIPKTDIHLLGTIRDFRRRLEDRRFDTIDRQKTVRKAWKAVYLKGQNIASRVIDEILSPESLVPVENAFSTRLSEFGFDFHEMIAPDLLHEFELGVWKRTFTHLLRILAANGGDSLQELDRRYRAMPTFGNGIIQRFKNVSSMKRLAGRDFEDLLQCALPVFEGLLPEPHNTLVCKLIFELATWHAFAKLRIHTESTVIALEGSTRRLGDLFRKFVRITCSEYHTRELPAETEARGRRVAALSRRKGLSGTLHITSKKVIFRLDTYKHHSLGDYPEYIRQFGTTDNYSTQLGEVEHKRIKKFYPRTKKQQYTQGIAKQQQRERLIQKISNADPYNPSPETPDSMLSTNRESHKSISHTEDLPPMPPSEQFQMTTDTRFSAKFNVYEWVDTHRNDPATADFIPSLRRHLFMQIMGYGGDRDEDEITADEANSIRFLDGNIYEHQRLRINYTTYDLRRNQDTINPRVRSDIMMLSPEFDKGDGTFHPYWYARVIKICHMQIYFTGHPSCPQASAGQRTMKFLFVRFFGLDKTHKYGWKAKHYPMVGFLGSDDNAPFGFVNPRHVLRAVHIIPAFHFGRADHTSAIHSIMPPTLARRPEDGDEDYVCYYVNMFPDRDIVMRFRGGGVGHKSTRHATNYFLEDRDSQDYPTSKSWDIFGSGENTEMITNIDTDIALELSDDEEAMEIEAELNDEAEKNGELDERHPDEVEVLDDDIDGRLNVEDELGFGIL